MENNSENVWNQIAREFMPSDLDENQQKLFLKAFSKGSRYSLAKRNDSFENLNYLLSRKNETIRCFDHEKAEFQDKIKKLDAENAKLKSQVKSLKQKIDWLSDE